jgi:DNA-binding NarL/FixJ family response regulator
MTSSQHIYVNRRHRARGVLEAGIAAASLLGAGWALARARRLLRESREALLASRARLALAEAEASEARGETTALAQRLSESRAEAERWKQDAADLIGGLGAAIDRQLHKWGLSPAEKEVALLLLKGLSHKEVASLRSVSETTVRQQARALYKKAGLEGRADLAAFFLEDLLAAR